MIVARTNYYWRKVRHAFASGNLLARLQRKVATEVVTFLTIVPAYLRLPASDKKLSVREGFRDHRQPLQSSIGSSRVDSEHASRIIAAYRAAKSAQKTAPAPYQIRGVWAEWISINYGELVEALNSGQPDALLRILENFSRDQLAVGTGGSYDDILRHQSPLFGSRYVRSVWCNYRNHLLESGCNPSVLDYPVVGNPAGVVAYGSIVPIETLRHAYYAHSIVRLLLEVDRPVVVEIGGGFGGQGHQTVTQYELSGRPFGKYLDFDIPEVLAVATYFLMKTFPARRFRLCGEGPVTTEYCGDFDFGMFPHFMVEQLGDLSADLVFNSHSFSEMDQEASSRYLLVIEKICKKYFMHINHDMPLEFREQGGSVRTNMPGSQLVPAERNFKRLYKGPSVLRRPEDRLYRAFTYLYERVV